MMKRLTYDECVGDVHCWQVAGADNRTCSEVCSENPGGCDKCPIDLAFRRLAELENILGDEYDLDKLRELIAANKDERCVILGVTPHLQPGINVSRCFILEDDGEITEDNVYCATVGPDNSGKMNVIYETFDSGDFGADEVGKRIFWNEDSAREAAKAVNVERRIIHER